jgi:type I restriction enzyme S subunit
VKIPSKIKEQKQIASILIKLDNKIEINNRINKNLEKIIMETFRCYFKNKPQNELKETTLGMIPFDWNIGEIGDYVKIKSGFAFKGKDFSDKGIKVIKIKDITPNGLNLNNSSCIPEDKISDSENFFIKERDLVIAMTGATIGKFSIVPKTNEKIVVNQRVGKFFLGNNPILKLPFLWGNLKDKRIFDEIINRGEGSAQPNISPTDIETIPIILPPKELINEFNVKMSHLFCEITNNIFVNEKLIKIRDILLPKLMSGKIDVSDVKI